MNLTEQLNNLRADEKRIVQFEYCVQTLLAY